MTRAFSLLALVTLGTVAAGQERQEVRIGAEELAKPAQRADMPTAGKWWLNRGSEGGPMLLTGKVTGSKGAEKEWGVTPGDRFVHYRVPTLVVDPKVKGWHKIYVGLLHEPTDPFARLFARLTREPYPEYLQAPDRPKSKAPETYWKAADLTGQKIHLEQPPAPTSFPGYGWYAGITHIRLVPMTDAEVAAAKQEIELPPHERRLFGMLDYTDEVFWWGTLETEEDIRAIVYRHRETGFGRIYWRAWGSHLDNSLSIPAAAPRWTDEDEKRWCAQKKCKVGWMPYISITKKFDPLKVAVEYGAKNDCEVHAWVRFTNLNREPYANFWHDNKKFLAQMLAVNIEPGTGKRTPIKPYKMKPYARVLSMAYPEVRAFYISFFKQLASTGTKGIMIDLLRHPPIAGYEPIVTEAFQQKYGKDMRELDVFSDPLVNEHLSGYLRTFLVDLRKEIGKDIEISVRSRGPDGFALRGKEWIAEGLIDSIVDGNWYSGNGPRSTVGATVEAAGTRGHAYAVIEPWDVDPTKGWNRRMGRIAPETIDALAKAYTGKGLTGIGVYESTEFEWIPELRHAIRRAGWTWHK